MTKVALGSITWTCISIDTALTFVHILDMQRRRSGPKMFSNQDHQYSPGDESLPSSQKGPVSGIGLLFVLGTFFACWTAGCPHPRKPRQRDAKKWLVKERYRRILRSAACQVLQPDFALGRPLEPVASAGVRASWTKSRSSAQCETVIRRHSFQNGKPDLGIVCSMPGALHRRQNRPSNNIPRGRRSGCEYQILHC